MPLKLKDCQIVNVEEHRVQDVNLKQGPGEPPFVDVLDRVSVDVTLPEKARFHGQDAEDGLPLRTVYQDRLAEQMRKEFGGGVVTFGLQGSGVDPCKIRATLILDR